MSIAPCVAEIVKKHVTLEVKGIDDVPTLPPVTVRIRRPEVSMSFDIAQRKNARLSCVEFRIEPTPGIAHSLHNFT